MRLTVILGPASAVRLAEQRVLADAGDYAAQRAIRAVARTDELAVLSDSELDVTLESAGVRGSGLVGYCLESAGSRSLSGADICRAPVGSPIGSGEFLAVMFSSVVGKAEVVASVDRFGSVPGYVASRGDLFVVSNDPLAPAIALGLTELDDEVAYQLFRYGHSISTHTTIRGVDRLPPGNRIVAHFSRSRLTTHLEIYEQTEWADLETPTREREERCFEALRSSSSRLLAHVADLGIDKNRTFYQLSGGLDSRLMCGGLVRENGAERGTAITYDLTDAAEIEIAADVATRLGLTHRTVPLEVAGGEDLRAGWRHTGGQVAVHAAAGNWVGYRSLHASPDNPVAIFGAWPGDVLAGSYVPSLARFSEVCHLSSGCHMWARSRGYPSSLLSKLVDDGLLSSFRSSSEQRVEADLAALSGATAAHRVTLWALQVRQPAFSFVSPGHTNSAILEITPCLDHAFNNLLLESSGVDLIAKNFYRRLILDALPELAGVSYHSSGAPITRQRVPEKSLASRAGLRELAVRSLHLPWPLGDACGRVYRRTAGVSMTTEYKKWSRLVLESDLSTSPYLSATARDTTRLDREKLSQIDVQLLGVHLALAWTHDHLRRRAQVEVS